MIERILNAAVCLSLSVALLAPHPASAQDEAPWQGETTPEAARDQEASADEAQSLIPADMKPVDFIAFFNLFSASQEIEEAFGPVMAQLLRTGDQPIEGWSRSGINMLEELARMEAKAGRKLVLRDTDEEVLSLTDLRGTAAPDLSRFKSYALRPEPVGLVSERAFLGFFPGVWFEVALQRTIKDNAQCYAGYYGFTLHTARPYSEWSEEELITVASVFALVDRLSSYSYCVVYRRAGDGAYLTTAYDPDGRPMTQLNQENTPNVLMPVADIATFMQRVPAPGGGAGDAGDQGAE
ncbi:MAG: hypothetical protein AAF650_11490 [Pseudomonadota bacterium]